MPAWRLKMPAEANLQASPGYGNRPQHVGHVDGLVDVVGDELEGPADDLVLHRKRIGRLPRHDALGLDEHRLPRRGRFTSRLGGEVVRSGRFVGGVGPAK